MAPKRSSRAQKQAYFVSVPPQPTLLDCLRRVEAAEEVSSINGFESPHHLQAKVEAGKRTVEDEIEAMASCDFDVGSARMVGVSRQSGGSHQGIFVSPYWGAAARRSLVEGIVQMHAPEAPEKKEASLAAHYEAFDDAVGRVMNNLPAHSPHIKTSLMEAMNKLLVSDSAREAFICWYNDFQDSFAEVWIDDPDKFGIAEDILACLVEEIKGSAGSAEPFLVSATSTGPVEPLIPVEQPVLRPQEPEIKPPEDEVILTFKKEQLVICAPYLGLRAPKENDVKSMFKHAKDVRGQRWRDRKSVV